MLSIRFNTEEIKEKTKQLGTAIESSISLAALVRSGTVEKVIANASRETFARLGARGSQPAWKALKPATVKAKRGQGQPLVRTGKMKAALSDPSNVQLKLEGKMKLNVKFTADVLDTPAAFHNFGTKFLPARPLISLTNEDAQQVAEALRNSIQEELKNKFK